jgi:hypothetical protein
MEPSKPSRLITSYSQADMNMRRADNIRQGLAAAQGLLQVPYSFDLEKPRDLLQQVGFDVANAPLRTRWMLYRYWANKFSRTCHETIEASMELYNGLCGQLEEIRNRALLEMMRELDIVGMTTTGAAKNVTLVQNMGAKVGE